MHPLRKTLLTLALILSPNLMAAEPPAWDVQRPPGMFKTVDIDVQEGTWMNLDISPDGKWMVFDLLGDLYRLPIAGGEAEALTNGVAWDMQPTISPDGNWIAFTSDRDGGDNIWILPSTGGEPRQVTKATFRLLNSPAWSPDGQYLVARKHFTGTRSLGAGEIWQYHYTGGEGIQLTSRDNDQKDLGEPAFSADGKYIYFSHDATPGKTFHYSRDSGQGIYKIKRFERQTGEIETIISRPGGAVRPSPSPDGRYLAFVGRDDFDSHLYLYDLESGEQTQLYANLDRDMQETWAIHGVYPTLAWAPSGDKLFFWAGGKIHEQHLLTGKRREIPFHVKAQKKIQKPLRFNPHMPESQFEVKMLRFAEISPSGYNVVFEALGKLWAKELPYGKPERITEQQDHFELYPSWSRDGRKLVYTTWDDAQQGSVRLRDLATGKTTILTQQPGKYVEPVISPDGDWVVYRKVPGNSLLPPTWNLRSGIYKVPVAGGEPLRIANQGVQPHFGADSKRVYLTTRKDDRPLFVSVDMDGYQQLRELYSSQHASEFKMSPTGQHLAFAEQFRVYVTPFTERGQAIEIAPKASNLPVQQLSKRAGEHLSWTADGEIIYWTLGPELFSQSVKELFEPGGIAEKMDLLSMTESGHYIGMMQPLDQAESNFAFVGGQVITMEGEQVIANGVVLVENNRIVAVGSAEEISIPEDAQRIDITGQTLMPGLVDAHAHGAQGSNEIVPQQSWRNYAGLALGVTTMHDPSNDTSTFFAASELQKAGEILAPRLFSTGAILYGADAPGYLAQVDSIEDARFHVERLKKVGAFSVKSYNQPRRNQRQQIIQAARELNMMVVPEGGSLLQHNLTMIADGHTTIEHAIPQAQIYADLQQLWTASGTAYTPTLVVAFGGIFGENYWYAESDVWKHPRLSQYVPPSVLQPRAMRVPKAPEHHYNHFNTARVAKELNDQGVLANIGAHGQREGLGAHWEIWMFEQGGMTPLQALKTATINPAITFGLEQHIGSIAKGKLADLIVIDGDPLTDIRVTDKVRYTMINGRLYDAESMQEVGSESGRQRQPFYFEE